VPYCLAPAGTPTCLCAHSSTSVGQQKKGKKEEEQSREQKSWEGPRVGRRQRHSRKKGWRFEEGKLSLPKPALLTEIDVRKYGHLPVSKKMGRTVGGGCSDNFGSAPTL